MNERRSRFERLERPRPGGGPDGDERPGAEGRFSGVSRDGAAEREPSAPGAPASAGDRFREPAARPPDVVPADAEEQPFIRCRRCETDNSRFGRTCTTCGEDLHGPEQSAFNQALWAERRRQRQEEERLSGERQRAQAQADAEVAEARRAAAEEMARQVGRRERSRLESGEWAGGGGWGDPWGGGLGDLDRTPIALRLLRMIRDPRWRVAAIGGYVGLVVLLFALAFTNRLFLVGAFALLMLALPRSSWRQRRRWWW